MLNEFYDSINDGNYYNTKHQLHRQQYYSEDCDNDGDCDNNGEHANDANDDDDAKVFMINDESIGYGENTSDSESNQDESSNVESSDDGNNGSISTECSSSDDESSNGDESGNNNESISDDAMGSSNHSITSASVSNSEESSNGSSADEEEVLHTVLNCDNCRRWESNPSALHIHFDPEYQIEVQVGITSTSLMKYRKFKLITNIDYNNQNQLHNLCHECAQHLMLEDKQNANQTKYTWPSFMWYFINNNRLHQKYSKELIWKFVPKKWRHWWVNSFFEGEEDTRQYIESPSPYFVDRTSDLKEWKEEISTFMLPNLRDVCNKYLIPTVLCPFGCSSFMHKCGHVSLDIIIQRYLPKYNLEKFISNTKEFKYVQSVREDYIRVDNDYDFWLLNRKWYINPTIMFVDGAPMVMTCNDHNNGTKSFIIHPPRSPSQHNLPSQYSDQLAHCAIRTRTVKSMCKRYYSTSYQMHHQKSSFNGIDTCNISMFRRFDFHSSLQKHVESCYILQRADSNALLNQLVEEKIISKFTANGKRDFALTTYSDFNFSKYYHGATFVPFEVAMSMVRDLTNNYCVNVTVDNRYVCSLNVFDVIIDRTI